MAAPLTKANVGTAAVAQLGEDPVAEPADLQRLRRASVISGMPVTSAPTQKMYGLPVTAMNAGSAAMRRVDGRVEAGQAGRAERVGLGVVEARCPG